MRETKKVSLHFVTKLGTSSSEIPSNNMAKDKSKMSIKCNQCDSAILVGNFGRHLKIHSDNRSYKCNQCDFASVDAGNFKRHVKLHSGEKNVQLQPMRLCICSVKQFEESFENSLR